MLRVRYQILTIFVLTAVVYANSIGNAFVMDDTSLVVYNPRVKSISNIPKMFLGSAFFDPLKPDESGGQFYRPIVSVVYAFLYLFGGQSPEIYHIFQIGLMGVNAGLVLLLLRKFVDEKWAWWSALVFAIHPLNQMTVGYISQLNDGLYLSFGLVAMWLVTVEKISAKRSLLICLMLLFSILAKESGILFVLAVFGYVAMFKREVWWRLCHVWVYFLSLYLFLRFVVAKVGYTRIPDIPIMRANLTERLMTMPKIIWYYIKTFFWPEKLVATQWWTVREMNWWDFGWPVLVLLSLVGLAMFGWWKLKLSDRNIYVFWMGWFVVGMGLHSQMWPLDWTVLDPWFGFSMIGLLAAAGLIVKSVRVGRFIRLTVLMALVLIIGLLGVRTARRNFDWKNGITLFTHDLQYEDNGYIRGALGGELMAADRYSEAIPHLQVALVKNPWGTPNWFNLGVAHERVGQVSLARENYLKFLSILETDFGYEKLLLLELKNGTVNQESGELADRAVKVYPQDYRLWLITGIVKYELGEKEAALSAVRRSFKLNPTGDAQYMEKQILGNEKIQLAD